MSGARRPARLLVTALAVLAWAAAGVALATRAGGAQADADAMFVGPAAPVIVEETAVAGVDGAGLVNASAGDDGEGALIVPAAAAANVAAAAASVAAVTDVGREGLRLGPSTGATLTDSPPPVIPGASEVGPTLTTLAGVVALIVIVFGGVHLARRKGAGLHSGRAPSGILEVLGRYPMAGGATLILLRAGPRVLLLSQARASRLGGSPMTTLAEFEDADEVASILGLARDARDESISARFGTLLSAFAVENKGLEGQGRLAARHDDVDEVDPDAVGRASLVGDDDGDDAYATRGQASSLLRRRLEGLRAWEGATA